MGTSVLLPIFNVPREPVKHFLMGNAAAPAGYPAKAKSKDLTSQPPYFEVTQNIAWATSKYGG